jgi:hypothetical protein
MADAVEKGLLQRQHMRLSVSPFVRPRSLKLTHDKCVRAVQVLTATAAVLGERDAAMLTGCRQRHIRAVTLLAALYAAAAAPSSVPHTDDCASAAQSVRDSYLLYDKRLKQLIAALHDAGLLHPVQCPGAGVDADDERTQQKSIQVRACECVCACMRND